MPRVYLDKFGHGPIFTIVNGVGVGMRNDPPDVMLVQCFLIGLLGSGKAWLGTDERFTPPDGTGALTQSGIWDETSSRYLTRWEGLHNRAQNYWSGGGLETKFAGTVVPYHKGGKKIMVMNEMCRVFFGEDNHRRLDLMGVRLRREAALELFYDPIYGPYDFRQS